MDIALEFLRAIGRLFLNPLLYIAIFVLIFYGYQRVKRERKFFKIRILNGWTELKLSIGAIVLSLVLSIVLLVIGAVLPVQFLFVIAIISALCLVIQLFFVLSPVVLFAAAVLILAIIHFDGAVYNIASIKIEGLALNAPVISTITIVAGVLLLAESQFIRNWATYLASPILERTKRGGKAVAYVSKSAWILPLFILIPGDVIPNAEPYFPIFNFGDKEFSLVVFPFIVGFKQLTRRMLPEYFYPQYSKSVMIIGQIVIMGGLAGYFEPVVAFILLMTGATLRILLVVVANRDQKKDTYAVVPTSSGTMIAAILPDSPAQKMGLKPGEVIKRVNGKEVFNERELYEALQVNAALCKLEVLDHQNELRLTQHAIHSDDHYRIGMILAQQNK